MKFPVPIVCPSCGHKFSTSLYADKDIPPAVCPQCDTQINLIRPLTISLVSDLLLHRASRELDEADFTLSIVCSGMAVESALTQVFLKWKGIDHLRSAKRLSTDQEKEAWEAEYRKKTSPGGFEKPANLVAEFLTGKKYDAFIADFAQKSKAAWIAAGFPPNRDDTKVDHTHKSLFVKRNRIMHWGEVGYTKEDAAVALFAATTAVSALKMMDRIRCDAMEKEHRAILDADAKRLQEPSGRQVN